MTQISMPKQRHADTAAAEDWIEVQKDCTGIGLAKEE